MVYNVVFCLLVVYLMKRTATELELLRWLYETLKGVHGLGVDVDEFIYEYFQQDTKLKVPKKYRWWQE